MPYWLERRSGTRLLVVEAELGCWLDEVVGVVVVGVVVVTVVVGTAPDGGAGVVSGVDRGDDGSGEPGVSSLSLVTSSAVGWSISLDRAGNRFGDTVIVEIWICTEVTGILSVLVRRSLTLCSCR
jgi:hypothetical protein